MIKLSYQISVDLDVLKALTAKLETDGQTHNDVLREVLGLDSPVETEESDTALSALADTFANFSLPNHFHSRGLSLPDGTELRARYKGREYTSTIQGGKWIDYEGRQQVSPSAAAGKITSTVVNGLRFWEAKRPGDKGWRRLDVIRDSLSQ
jgi:hypothetical protein